MQIPPAPAPKVIFWYKLYVWSLVLLYLLVAAIGPFLLLFSPEDLEMNPAEHLVVVGACIATGLFFTLVSAVPLFFRPRPWLWVYGIVLIALGMTSCCFWPAVIPLLIFWIKPETRLYFGRPA